MSYRIYLTQPNICCQVTTTVGVVCGFVSPRVWTRAEGSFCWKLRRMYPNSGWSCSTWRTARPAGRRTSAGSLRLASSNSGWTYIMNELLIWMPGHRHNIHCSKVTFKCPEVVEVCATLHHLLNREFSLLSTKCNSLICLLANKWKLPKLLK